MTNPLRYVPLFLLFLLGAAGAFGQRGQSSQPIGGTPQPTATPEPNPGKKNGRPASLADPRASVKPLENENVASYQYEFSRPGFTYGKIIIKHDDSGKGTITFSKSGADEEITDPVHLSAATMAKIRDLLTGLNFLDSSEDYQYQRDYSHLGNISITYRKAAKERTAKFNWTENKPAKELADEYRRIANEYTWRFEVELARTNQPLQLPGLMDLMDGYLKRNEISDPPHLLPLLNELSNDERLPLMARNRAFKMAAAVGGKR